MDSPTSPVQTVSLALLTSCGKVLNYIANYIRDVQNADSKIQELQVEVDTLKSALTTVHQTEKDSQHEKKSARLLNVVADVGGAATVKQNEYWKTLQNALSDCMNALSKLEELLKDVNGVAVPIMRKATLQRRLASRLHEIDSLRAQIAAYRKSVQLSVGIMTMYYPKPCGDLVGNLRNSQLRTEAMTKTRFDELGKEVKELRFMLEALTSGALTKTTPNALKTLKTLASSADEVVRQASEYFSARSRMSMRSANDGTMAGIAQERTRVWVNHTSTVQEDFRDENGSEIRGGSASYTGRTSITHENQKNPISKAFNMGKDAYKAGNYIRAKDLLCSFKQKIESKEAQGATVLYQERIEKLPLLVLTYCRLEEWDNAADTLSKIPIDGRERCLLTLLGCYMQLKKWDDALNVLSRPNFPPGEVVSEEPEWRKDLLVAEICMEKGDYDEAIAAGVRAQEELQRTLGHEHIWHRMATDLLGIIYERQGNQIDAEIMRHEEPVEELKVCRVLEVLNRLWPEQAAEFLQASLSPYLKLKVPWDEIIANVKEGNITGSGRGYTLLHAFIAQKWVFAADFLLELGIDVNAKTKAGGATALHLAVQSRHEPLVRLLLSRKADPHAKDANEVTVWSLVTQPAFESMVHIVADSVHPIKATEGPANGHALLGAIEREDEAMCEFLLNSGVFKKKDIRDASGATPLHKAIQKKNLGIAKLLQKHGADFNARTEQGVTVLMTAVSTGDEEMVKFVLEQSPNLEARDEDNYTALSRAAMLGVPNIVGLLISRDAECAKDYPLGQTPQELAVTFEILEMLHQARMAKKSWWKLIPRDELEDHYEAAKIALLTPDGKLPERHESFKYHRGHPR